jgi:hypothetical protein
MNRSGLIKFLVLLVGISMFLLLTVSSFTPARSAFMGAPCDPKLCTPTYPPKVTDTATYPPKVTPSNTYPPKPSHTPVIPSSTSTPKPTVIYWTSTPTASLTATTTSTPTDTATLKPTVLGITSTTIPTVTRTLVPAIPIFQPTVTLQPLTINYLFPSVDLYVTGMEVSQAIQVYGTNGLLDNSIPLVARKKTIIRVYVKMNGPTYSDVTGRLTITGGGSPGRVHLPIAYNPSGTIRVGSYGSQREYENSTLNFIMDSDEVYSGNRHLSVTIYFVSGRSEINTANNTFTMDIRFQEVPAISFFGVSYGNDGTDLHVPFLAAPSWSDMLAHAAIAKNMSPVANFSVGYFPGLGTSPLMVPDLEFAREWADRMLARPEYSTSRIYLLQPEGDCGCGLASGRRMNGQNATGISTGSIMAQEVAHSYGMWWHAVAPEHPADLANPLYPFPHGSMGSQIGVKTEPGFTLFMPLYSYGSIHIHDFMSYGPSPTWVSPFTYCTYLNTLTSGAVTCPSGAERASVPAAPIVLKPGLHTAALARVTYLYVAGILNPDGTASFEPFEQMTSTQDISQVPSGDAYHLVFKSAGDQVLKDIPFTPVETHHDEVKPSVLFNLTVPYPSGTASIQLFKNGNVLAKKFVSAHTPKVHFDLAGNDQQMSGSHNFKWTAGDVDGDPLIYSIEYSPDNGSSWLTLNVGLTSTTADVNFDALPGTTQGLLRIVASDGVNTSEARSTGTFRVERKTPVITSISGDATTYQGQPVFAEVTAYDWEDGSITDPAAIAWSSNLDGALGSGPWIAPGDLSVGEHTITASVVDSDGNTVSKSIHIKVLAADNPVVTGPVSFYAVAIKYGAVLLGIIIILTVAFMLLKRKKR